MTHSYTSALSGRSPGLPDPELRPEFYNGLAFKRFMAWLVDLVLVGLMVALAVLFTIGIGLFFLPVIWAIIDFCYRVISLSGKAATPGHRLMGIEFRDRLGQRPNFGASVLLTLGYLVSTAFIIPQLISAVMVMVSPRAQSLTDLVLGTAAINRPAREW